MLDGGVVLIYAAAAFAARGLSKIAYFWCGVLLGVIGIVLALVMPVPGANVRAGDLIATTNDIRLSDGTEIPKGHRSKVHDMDVVEGRSAVEIDGPGGKRHWISKSLVRQA